MRLSLCIPTYNRGPFIGELLDSIIAQTGYGCELEVVVSDNASDDETQEVIERYRSRIPDLIYHRAAQNMGADRNFLKVVELAGGDYCWLMGSDDKLEPGSIAEIEKHCLVNPGIAGLSLNRNAYAYALDRRIYERPVAGGELPRDTRITGAERIFFLLGEYFGYLSGQVVNRALWNRVVASENVEEYFNAYVHIYVIGRMVQIEPTWFYVVKPCVGWRSANDSFLSQGEFKRMSIDVVGYEKIARGLFGARSATYHQITAPWIGACPLRDPGRQAEGGGPILFQEGDPAADWQLLALSGVLDPHGAVVLDPVRCDAAGTLGISQHTEADAR